MGVTKSELENLRCKYRTILEQFNDSVNKNVFDSAGATREIVYKDKDVIAMIGKGAVKGDHTIIKNDVFHKSVAQIKGSFDVVFSSKERVVLNDLNRYVEIPPMRDYKATTLEDDTVSLIVLRRTIPLILFILFLGVAYGSPKIVKYKKQQTTEEPK